MSRPISAMMTWAAVVPMPGISSRRVTTVANGAMCSSMRVWTSAMSALSVSIRRSMVASRNAWWSSNRGVEGFS
jgi:hypothetical protein